MNKNSDLIALSKILVNKNKLIHALGSSVISFNTELKNKTDTINTKENQLTQKENVFNEVYFFIG